jgi:hypothetical protein
MPRTRTPRHERPATATVVLHGRHPLRGYPVTWHVTQLSAPGTTPRFVVERADGHLVGEGWALAEKHTEVLDMEHVRDLVRSVDEDRGH